MSIADKVKTLREHRGMSQEDLAAASGVGRSTISLIENGRIVTPGATVVQRLAKALGVPITYLLNEDEDVRVEIPPELRLDERARAALSDPKFLPYLDLALYLFARGLGLDQLKALRTVADAMPLSNHSR